MGIHRSPLGFHHKDHDMESFDDLFNISLTNRLSKQPSLWWFDTSDVAVCGKHNFMVLVAVFDGELENGRKYEPQLNTQNT